MKRGNWTHECIEGREEWLTPPEVLAALGDFDLDPCASVKRPWPTAKKHYTKEDDGLKQPWTGRVWCNPPYGDETHRWLARLVEHRNGLALIFARTETETFHRYVFNAADAILFLRGRLAFCNTNGSRGGTAGSPSVLIAYDGDGVGSENVECLRRCGLQGKLWVLR